MKMEAAHSSETSEKITSHNLCEISEDLGTKNNEYTLLRMPTKAWLA